VPVTIPTPLAIRERLTVYAGDVRIECPMGLGVESIDGLCAIVGAELGRNPADRCLYVFTNRERNKIKLLVWHLNGYWLLYK
jgi:transposase